MALKSGDIVGDYRVVGLAGAGGMAAVYKIEHVITKRIEAMKVLPTGIGAGPQDIQRFEREIAVQARLHHPNIAALFNAVRDEQSIALIMEYVEGETLQRILERGKLPLPTAVDYAGQILDALAYAHDQGVVHRDVTPANIIITPQGAAKLTDFGLALSPTDLRLTSAGVPVGSAWYMSPEQVRAAERLDGRTDLYALGAVLYEMLTGRKLFEGDGAFAVMRAQMEAIPHPPSAFNPEVPESLDAVLARTLAKDPEARFPNAGEFRAALDAAAGTMRNTAAVAESAAPAISLAAAEAAKPRWRRQWFLRSSAAAALILVSIALVAVACILVWPEPTRPAAPAAVPSNPAPPVPPAALPPPQAPVEAAKPVPPPPAPPHTSSSQRTAAATTPKSMASNPSTDATPAKSGNRVKRALGKLNPFHKGVKSDSADTANRAAK